MSPKARLLGFGLGVAPLASFAAVPAAVQTAVDSMLPDAMAIATVVLVAIISLAAFKFIRRGL